ncbi:MAG: P-II family nitrogen regulator [Peptostreptococcales bacterium]
MLFSNHSSAFEIMYVITSCGMGSKVLQEAKKHGVLGGVIMLGKGSGKSSVFNFLGLYNDKEIVMMGADKDTADNTLIELNKEFQFTIPNQGIAFSTSACGIVGENYCNDCKDTFEREGRVEKPMFQLITTIVNRGDAERVIEAANEAGSKGGTIINARGAGIHETAKVFNMVIEPEKEIVIILSQENDTEGIVNNVRKKLELDKGDRGLIIVQDVNRAYGSYFV